MILRGSSLFCPCDHEVAYQQLASFGENLVRIPIEWTQLEPTAPTLQGGQWQHTYNAAYLNTVIVGQFYNARARPT